MSPFTPDETAVLEKIVSYSARFYQRSWVWGTAGNFSMRRKTSPLEVIVTASGVQKGELTLNDFIAVQDGEVTYAPPNKKPSDETAIHESIYRSTPDAQVILHAHPIHATLFSELNGDPQNVKTVRLPWQEMLKGVGVPEGGIAEFAIFPNWQKTERVGSDFEHFVQTCGGNLRPVVFLYQHGLTAWGRTPEEALRHLEVMEYVCQYNWLKEQTPRVVAKPTRAGFQI